jgi:hypothetical protein
MARRASRECRAALVNWGNWYILRSSHEFGWPSADALLAEFGSMIADHRILIDMPRRVRAVDLSVGRLMDELRRVLVLTYCWDRDLRGYPISDFRRSQAMGTSMGGFDSLLCLAETSIEGVLDTLRERVNTSGALIREASIA